MDRQELAAFQHRFFERVQTAQDNTPLSVYKNTSEGMRLRALQLIFPTCLRIVGEGCFNAIAHDYMRERPCTHSSLDDEGALFWQTWQSCIETRPGFEDFQYLPDLARLERVRHDVFCANTDESFDWEQGAQMHPDLWANARPVISQSFRVFRTQWSLFELFDGIDLEARTCDTLWLHRAGDEVAMGYLSEPMVALMSALMDGVTMDLLSKYGLESQHLFEATSRGWIVGVDFGGGHESFT